MIWPLVEVIAAMAAGTGGIVWAGGHRKGQNKRPPKHKRAPAKKKGRK